MKAIVITIGLFLSFSATPASAQFGNLIKTLGLDKQESLGDDTIVSGLKEALQIGTENSVKSTGREDGYFRNEAIKILLPEKMRALEKGLRMVGYGDKIDSFVLSMNRAAEKAAPLAKDIFWDAIRDMSFQDARQILQGDDTAATQYFESKTRDSLAGLFAPVVRDSMSEVGVTRQYEDLVGRYQKIPFVNVQEFDLNQFVVDKALFGLFHILGEEERKIRKNPADRVTDLLKTVFGG